MNTNTKNKDKIIPLHPDIQKQFDYGTESPENYWILNYLRDKEPSNETDMLERKPVKIKYFDNKKSKH